MSDFVWLHGPKLVSGPACDSPSRRTRCDKGSEQPFRRQSESLVRHGPPLRLAHSERCQGWRQQMYEHKMSERLPLAWCLKHKPICNLTVESQHFEILVMFNLLALARAAKRMTQM